MNKKSKSIVVIVSFLLIICMFNGSIPTFATPVANVAKDLEAFKEADGVSAVALDERENKELYEELDLLNDCSVLKYVDEKEFSSKHYVYRAKDKETLNTYVFQSEDGKRSVYILDENVKFIDETGRVVEKDLSLVETERGYRTAKNDIGVLFPYSLKNGITFDYDGSTVTIAPVVKENAKAEVEENAVLYKDAFGPKTVLKYTPTLSGLKEDVILTEYVPGSYTFTVYAEELNLYEDADGWYFAKEKEYEEAIRIGKIVVYDADGKPSIGTMSVDISGNDTMYTVTISADEDFLKDESTVYPVTIDPTFTVSYGNNGNNYIIDAPIFEGYPNNNYGTYLYNRVGTPNNNYKRGRTVVKLTGLTESSVYQSLSANQISSVLFKAKEASGGSAQNIRLYRLTSNTTWTETNVTWNNVGSYDTSVNYGNSMYNGAWTDFDITNLVKGWKAGTYSANAGFIMMNENETANNKSFCSSEHTTTDNRPYVVMEYTVPNAGGANFDEAQEMILGAQYSVNINSSGINKYFSFTPNNTGFYTFESLSIVSGDPVARLYNNSQEQLVYNDDGGQEWNFRIAYHLIESVTYYLKVGCYNTGTGTYDIIVKNSVSSDIAANIACLGANYNVSTSYEYQVSYYKFTPSVTNKYLTYSFNNTSDPKVWIYNSNLNLVESNDDTAGNYNFRISREYSADQTYYLVAAHYDSYSGSYSIGIVADANIPSSIFYIRNCGSHLYVDIDNASNPVWAYQWAELTNNYERWVIKKQSDGFYTIESKECENIYLGVTSAAIGTNNIKLFSSISESTKWSIYELQEDILIFEPKTAIGKILIVPNSSTGTKMQLQYLYGVNNSALNKWSLKSMYIEMNTYYDNAFNVRYTYASILVSGISGHIERLLWNTLGVRVQADTPEMIESTPDKCKLERGLTINTTTINNASQARCPANPSNSLPDCPYYDINSVGHSDCENCTSWYQPYRDFIRQYPGTTTTASVLFCGSKLYNDSGSLCNRSYHWYNHGIIIQKIVTNSDTYESKVLPTVLHEMSHDIGAPDHYHEMIERDGQTVCRGGDMCIVCHPDTGRPGWCLMCTTNHPELSSNDCDYDSIYCEACLKDMLNHLNGHHFE